MSQTNNLIFIGTSGAIQIPSFHCTCRTCEETRKNPDLSRTRASVVLSGNENILIDATPDVEFQLEREKIRFIDRIFLTHWHYDHCFGLGAFPELGRHGTWKKEIIDLYLPKQDLDYFENIGFSWTKQRYKIHPIMPGDIIRLPDFTFEVVKTNHTVDSVGYIIKAPQKTFAYLVDGITPPKKTIERLKENDLDFVILEGTVDELILPEGETIEDWKNFSITDAVTFWKTLNIPKCILTHTSFHMWKVDKLLAGLTPKQRKKFEENNRGLKFAYDGMRIEI
ncbi:MAG: MBL fold metallo-hydrolase [Candidatus Thorarchaeota archaeon]